MMYSEFVSEVQQRGNLPAKADTERIIDGVLSTFGERLEHHMRKTLGSQLPNELKDYLGRRDVPDVYDLEEFYNRVHARADIGYPDAVRLSKVVMGTIAAAVSTGLVREVLAGLPMEFGELFGFEPDRHSPSRPQGT